MKTKFYFFYGLMLLLFIGLFFRLFSLTIIDGNRNRVLADGQRIRIKRLPANRGIIFDRNNIPLTRNIPIYKICDDKTLTCKKITRDEALKLEASNKDANLVTSIGREYPYTQYLAHLLGYLGEASADEVLSGKWLVGSLLGRSGLEDQYEDYLKGKDGGELLEVDTSGTTLRKIGRTEAKSGNNLYLSIDLELQKIALDSLAGKKGAIVAQDPKTGQIMALVSSPSFDPNILMNPEDPKITKIFNDPNMLLFNRVIGGAYPPGSTFKLIVSTAGLEEGKINATTKIEDNGPIVINEYSYRSWSSKIDGLINVSQALKRSNDIFFYKLAEMVGARKIVEWSKKFGVGQKTGIDLPGEIPGFLPEIEKEWFLGNTYHLGIGQGNLGLTPLQVNLYTSVVANGGSICKPKIRKSDTSDCQKIGMDSKTLNTVEEGMEEACAEGGTAGWLFANFNPKVACKTGTAEYANEAHKTHAWFTVYAPSDDPQIAISVLVEGGGDGSEVAAPIAKAMLEQYFKN